MSFLWDDLPLPGCTDKQLSTSPAVLDGCAEESEPDMSFLWDDLPHPGCTDNAESDVVEVADDINLAMHSAGLDNLGNTCFMNSSLQCLANIPCLRDFFITGLYRESLEVNGLVSQQTAGRLAEGFAMLLRQVWSDSTKSGSVRPRSFKDLIGTLCDRFQGCTQHDAMEFVEFLLDGLKEDCNMVKGPKLNSHRPDAQGRPDREVALEVINNILLRSDSKVDDLLMGIFKNTTACPRRGCGHESIVFDPFLSVKVPVPVGGCCTEVLVTVTVVPSASSGVPVMKCTVSAPGNGNVGDLICAVAAEVGSLCMEHCELFEIFNSKIYSHFKRDDELSDICACDVLVMYELENPQPTREAVSLSTGSMNALKQGDIVMVKSSIQSNSKSKVALAKGVAGRVVKIDAAGAACIKFDGIDLCQWVFQRSHGQLSRVLRADSEECREDPETGRLFTPGEYVEAFRRDFSCAELHRYWRYEMVPFGSDPSESEDDVDEIESCEVFVHFRCVEDKLCGKKLFGFPLILRTKRSIGTSDLEDWVCLELTLRFGPDSMEHYSMYRAKDFPNLVKTREFLVGGTAEPHSVDPTSGEHLYLVVEWEGEPPAKVSQVLAETEECGMVDECDQEVALEACLESLTAPEQLGEGDTVRCEECGHQGRAMKQLEFWSAPPVLTLQLKRFEYVGNYRQRLSTPVRFPLEGLDLSDACLSPDGATFPSQECFRAGQHVLVEGCQTETDQSLNGMKGKIVYLDTLRDQFCVSLSDTEGVPQGARMLGRDHLRLAHSVSTSEQPAAPVYDLVAVSTHIGHAFFGHYVAYARSCEDGLWRLYDDDDVREVAEQEVTADKVGAYLLFYIRRDHRPAAWGSPAVADTE
mmetsp:Transcript_89428/g.164105  ORF Transcript_89428/g.164105 Transcript_89428/m.164105 type:complete len:865 (-) Transcript_89428:246-2840(-)